MTNKERNYWLAFSSFPGIGPLRFKLLREYFGSAASAWKAPERELLGVGLGGTLVSRFADFRRTFSIHRYAAALERNNIHVITIDDPGYPKRLKEIPDAPFLLYLRGESVNLELPFIPSARDERTRGESLWELPMVAVVGTRRMTAYGKEATKRIVHGLAAAGCVVVSGLAYGIDTVAHETAVAAGGKTVAVLGCGVDVIHPRSNTTLYWTIVKKAGAALSEFPQGQYAAKGLFPARNRIISGLPLGTVVIEGASDSGALITARYAAEQGRDVFAVPGPITSPMSEASSMLLKQGAKVVTRAEDVLEELNIKHNAITQSALHGRQADSNPVHEIMKHISHEEKSIIELLQRENLHFDELIRQSMIPAAKVGTILTMMEMKGLVKNRGGGIYGIG